VLVHPYDERDGLERFAQPPDVGSSDTYRTFCGT
jgi:hypothetical protein